MKYKEKMDSKELTEIFFKNLNEKISHQIEEINSKLSKHQLKIDNNLNFDEMKKTLEIAVNAVVVIELDGVLKFIESFKDNIDEITYNEIVNNLQNRIKDKPIFEHKK